MIKQPDRLKMDNVENLWAGNLKREQWASVFRTPPEVKARTKKHRSVTFKGEAEGATTIASYTLPIPDNVTSLLPSESC
jgi:hypothetical protein